ncbi:MAG: HIRAN domain-containing protein [Actinobacteria bacterium]|nr:HIRAN domain-containing protein [Actinomycetota bacterium]
MHWNDERLLIVPLAGASYRPEALQDDAFTPGRLLALVPEPENQHDPNAVGIWDAERLLQGGYVPADATARVPPDAQAVSLWEFQDVERRRVGLRVLIAPADAWIGLPRP